MLINGGFEHQKKVVRQASRSIKGNELGFEQVRCYKQTLNQTMILHHHHKILDLRGRTDPSITDSMKLQHLMVGVKESLKLHIVLHDSQSTDAFLSYARKVEDT